jgi:DNA modification methylase
MPEGALVKRYIEPPFSVLNARSRRWQDRKQGWLQLGIRSELGRDVQTYDRVSTWINTHIKDGHAPKMTRSVFDPVLCELVYRWFCPERGVVIDPFAGGSVRGIVAALLRLDYHGIELSSDQVTENQAQAGEICGARQPKWIVADAWDVLTELGGLEADLIFSCPPYWNLERYSEDERDLSSLSWCEFLHRYREIVRRVVSLLKPNRFAVFVVGNIRDRDGCYIDLTGHTIRSFEDAGTRLWNEAVLITEAGTAPVRAARPFEGSRKLAKVHQSVLVFCKGDARRAAAAAHTGLRTEQDIAGEKAS